MLKLLKRMSKKELIPAFMCVILVAFQVYLDLRLPDYMAAITNVIANQGSQVADIWIAGGKMMLCALGSLAASAITAFLAAGIASNFAKELRYDIFTHVQSFSMGEISHFSTPGLITRSTNDVTQVQMLIAMGLQVIVKAPIMALWAIFKIAGKGTSWTAATAISVAFLLTVVIVVSSLVIPKFRRIQKLMDSMNRVMRENLTGIRVIRAYNAEQYQQSKFDKVNETYMKTNLFTSRAGAFMMPCMTIVMNGLTLSVYIIGASMLNQATLTEKAVIFSNMVVFSQYAMQVVMAFVMLTMIFIMLPRVTVSARRINEVLQTELSVKDGKGVTEADDTKGLLEFRNVSFKYPGADDYVIKNISFTAKQGQTVAFIGSTGSGKSTVINLIPRFYDTTEGEIFVDGVNIKDYTQAQLRKKIGYIPQSAVIFSGSVESNVAFGDNCSTLEDKDREKLVKTSLDIAQGSEFVDKMPQGIKTDIARGGTNVSGGQKQRIGIARAVCRQPEIFIFDDSFSALDYKTDRSLRTALKESLFKATCIIVAQRIGTIRDADKIIVLEEGKQVGMGTHAELMENCEVYREIALSQLSEEELSYGRK